MKEMKMVGGLSATENLRYGPQADLDYTVDENGNKIPEMTLGDVPPEPLTYYGMKRLEFLNKHKPIEAEILFLHEKLWTSCYEIEQQAKKRFEEMMEAYKKNWGITEELKEKDPMRWVRLMNTAKEEINQVIFRELIYS